MLNGWILPSGGVSLVRVCYHGAPRLVCKSLENMSSLIWPLTCIILTPALPTLLLALLFNLPRLLALSPLASSIKVIFYDNIAVCGSWQSDL